MQMIAEKLAKVQASLKAPKGQRNSFGNYNYRSAEDILEAAKPLCVEGGLCLTLSDVIVPVGERIYVQATATVRDTETGESLNCTAYAREPQSKKGMDESQVTGMASSYARKYALNGLFCIDDTKDADTDEANESRYKAPVKAEEGKQTSKARKAPQKRPQADTEALDAAIARAKAAVIAFAEKEGIEVAEEWQRMQHRDDVDRASEGWWVARAIEYEAR